MGCGVYWQQVHTLDESLRALENAGIGEDNPAYQVIWQQRGEVISTIGKKFPRKVVAISHEGVLSRLHTLGLEYAGASPGFTAEELKNATIKVWLDIESGWMAEARFRPGAPPIYRKLTAEQAISLIKREETPKLIAQLFHEDDYIGE